LGKKQDPLSKITRSKRAGGAAQAVESLPSKYKALNLNPSTAKKFFLKVFFLNPLSSEVVESVLFSFLSVSLLCII
jgi:hypothetical protein